MNDFGVEARRLMTERNLSLRGLARQVHCDPSYLSKVLNGRKPASVQLASLLDGELGANGKLADLAPAPEPRMRTGGKRPGNDLRRKEFILLAGVTVAALDVLHLDMPERLEAARIAGRVDDETIDGLSNLILGYRQVYRSAGAASLLNPVCGTLNLLTELSPGAGRHREKMISLIGQAASLIGTILMFDLGDFRAARRYLAIGAQAAQQSGDNELMAITLACHAFNAAYDGNAASGIAYASAAMDVAAKQIHPRSHGWVAAVTSEMHATAGRAGEASCMRALDIADEQLASPMPAEAWEGIGAFDASKLSAYRGGDLLRLGRHPEAQAELKGALDKLGPGLVKHRCTALIDLADACAKDHQPDQSGRHAISALEIVTRTRHAESLRRVLAVHEAIRRSGSVEARELGSRLMEFRAAS